MDPDRIAREEPEWAAQLDRRHAAQGKGAWKYLLPAIAADVARQPILTPGELRGIRLPVQLIYGDRDVFVPADHAVAVYRQLPDARLLIAPDCPHQVMVYQPALFNQACGGFYRSTEHVARQRAERGGTVAAGNLRPGTGAAALDPRSVATDSADPFSNW